MEFVTLSASNFSRIVQSLGEGMPNMETLLFQDKKSTEDTIIGRIGAITEEGRMIGFGLAVAGPWDPILRPGYFQLLVIVEEKFRKQGIGDKIYKILEQFARNQKAIALQGAVRESEPDSLKWAKKRQYHIESHTFESTLDLSKFNYQKYKDVLNLKGSLHFTSFAAYPQNDKWFKHLFDFWWEIARDTPGMEGKQRPDMEQMKVFFEAIDPSGVILIKDGEKWIAISLIIWENQNVYYNNLTGVIRPYRGKGLALSVKTKGVQYAIEQNAKYLRTHNDSNNVRMLAVNRKMGYEPIPGFYSLIKPI